MFNRLRTLRTEREDGFTLIEILVTILIVGILTSIAVPVYLNQKKQAYDAALKSDIKNATAQIELWQAKNPGVAIPDIYIKMDPEFGYYADWYEYKNVVRKTDPLPIDIRDIKLSTGTIIYINEENTTENDDCLIPAKPGNLCPGKGNYNITGWNVLSNHPTQAQAINYDSDAGGLDK